MYINVLCVLRKRPAEATSEHKSRLCHSLRGRSLDCFLQRLLSYISLGKTAPSSAEFYNFHIHFEMGIYVFISLSGEIAWVVECLPGIPEALGSISEPHKPGVVIHTCITVHWDAKAGGSEVQYHP